MKMFHCSRVLFLVIGEKTNNNNYKKKQQKDLTIHRKKLQTICEYKSHLSLNMRKEKENKY